MSALRPAPATISDFRWLNKREAMAYTHRRTEKTFDEDFGKHVNRYQGRNSFLYDKQELDRRMKSFLTIKVL